MKTLSLLSVALFATASLAFAPTATADPNEPTFCKNVTHTQNETDDDYTCSTGVWVKCGVRSSPPKPGTCQYCTSYHYHKNETEEKEEYSGCLVLSI
jgi:hypothetical protein